ncbi:unnamed protein product [Protopolystoma xenopodis]|uniref:Uncharacterized protein n=1 Tax=Protopolystoma xenopodis TaxID=117903 RepID=A0A448X3H9_9PLAT|nr:unnamed protein product [Protopolystoma xenopodis]
MQAHALVTLHLYDSFSHGVLNFLNSGVTLLQCADIAVAFAQAQNQAARQRQQIRSVGLSHRTAAPTPPSWALNLLSIRNNSAGTSVTSLGSPDAGIFLLLARWIKGRTYVVSADSDSTLDPQPGYTCHLPAWSRFDTLDPASISLSDIFQKTQVDSP